MKPEEAEQYALKVLDLALAMELNLSQDEVTYDLLYVTQKLALCSSFLEKLSDLQLNLTKVALAGTREYHHAKQKMALRQRELRELLDASLSRTLKAEKIEKDLEPCKLAVEAWSLAVRVVSEVREALGDRVQLMKRLDSDVRLHQKLLEVKVASGAGGPGLGFPKHSSRAGEIDL